VHQRTWACSAPKADLLQNHPQGTIAHLAAIRHMCCSEVKEVTISLAGNMLNAAADLSGRNIMIRNEDSCCLHSRVFGLGKMFGIVGPKNVRQHCYANI